MTLTRTALEQDQLGGWVVRQYEGGTVVAQCSLPDKWAGGGVCAQYDSRWGWSFILRPDYEEVGKVDNNDRHGVVWGDGTGPGHLPSGTKLYVERPPHDS